MVATKQRTASLPKGSAARYTNQLAAPMALHSRMNSGRRTWKIKQKLTQPKKAYRQGRNLISNHPEQHSGRAHGNGDAHRQAMEIMSTSANFVSAVKKSPAITSRITLVMAMPGTSSMMAPMTILSI